MNFRHWLSLAGLIVLAFAPVLRAADDVDIVGDLVFVIHVPGGLGAADVHDAVRAAAVGREYTIKEDKPDHIIFTLTHRKHEANFTAVFDTKAVRLYSDSYELDNAGARKEPSLPPDNWVKYLRQDFTTNLDQAAVLKK
jgi:hypothetical protein